MAADMTEAEKITLTPEELAALVDSQIAKRDAGRELEAARIRRMYDPPATPAPSINAPSELVAEFGKALDLSGGDVDKATFAIVGWLAVDPNGRAVYPDFKALFSTWGFANDVLHPQSRALLIRGVIENLKSQRERTKAGV
jgi:hypothetical protein